MSRSSELKSYGTMMKLCHWSVVCGVIAQVVIGFFSDDFANKHLARTLMGIHKSIGLTLVALSLLFILTGVFSRKPAWPKSMPLWEKMLAHVVQYALYALVFIMSSSGWCMSTASGHTPNWFGWFQLAAPGVPQNEALATLLSQVHTVCAWLITSLFLLHAIAALKHQFLDKDNMLVRMWPGR